MHLYPLASGNHSICRRNLNFLKLHGISLKFLKSIIIFLQNSHLTISSSCSFSPSQEVGSSTPGSALTSMGSSLGFQTSCRIWFQELCMAWHILQVMLNTGWCTSIPIPSWHGIMGEPDKPATCQKKNSFQLYLDWHYSLRCRRSLSPWLIDQDQRRQTLMNKTCFLCSLSLSSLPPFNSFTSEYSLHVITHVLAVELSKWTSTLGGYYQWCDVLCGHSSSSFPGILNLMFCFLLSSI